MSWEKMSRRLVGEGKRLDKRKRDCHAVSGEPPAADGSEAVCLAC